MHCLNVILRYEENPSHGLIRCPPRLMRDAVLPPLADERAITFTAMQENPSLRTLQIWRLRLNERNFALNDLGCAQIGDGKTIACPPMEGMHPATSP